MRKLILATVSLTCVFGMAHAGSFLTLGQSSSHNSAVKAEKSTTIFELYGPSASDCSKVSCPSQKDLEKLARKGTTVMKVAGGDVAMFDNVFGAMPKPQIEKIDKKADKPDAMSEKISVQESAPDAIEPELVLQAPESAIDGFKTGPLSDGSIQPDIAGVDTEFLPDLEPEFEPEFASSIDDAAGALGGLSASSMEALNNAM